MSSFLVNKLDILLFELYFQISLNNCLEELYVFIFITSEVFNEQDFLEERTLSR